MGARAFIIAALAGPILVSLAPASPLAVEPTADRHRSSRSIRRRPDPGRRPAPSISHRRHVEARTTEAQQIIRIAQAPARRPVAPRRPRAARLRLLGPRHLRVQAGPATRGRSGAAISPRPGRCITGIKARHKASRHHPKVGDLVIWGGGTHVGIYIGHGKAISTLTNGVRVHRVHAVTARFTAYLHTGMWKKAAG